MDIDCLDIDRIDIDYVDIDRVKINCGGIDRGDINRDNIQLWRYRSEQYKVVIMSIAAICDHDDIDCSDMQSQ